MNRNTKKNYQVIIIAAFVVLSIFMMGGILFGVKIYTQLQEPTYRLATTSKDSSNATPVESTTTLAAVPTALSESLPKVCGQSGSWIILALGRTIHKSVAPAEMIRLLKVDFDQKSAVIYSFPPDLVVETPGLTEKYQIRTLALQDIFRAIVLSDGESKTTETNASQATAQAILDNFGIAADHYLTIKEDLVEEMVDTVGGIDVVMPQDFTMPESSTYQGLVLEAGNQHLDGEMVHAIFTYRENAVDEPYRNENQNAVLGGIWKKLLDPLVYVRIPELYSTYKEDIITDLNVEQIAALNCLIRLIPPKNVFFDSPTIEQLIVKEDGATYMKNPEQLIPEIQAFFRNNK